MGSQRREALLVGAGIVLVAFNLRPAVTSMGALLGDVRGGLRLSTLDAAVLTTLPTLCFAVFGALAPRLARRLGSRRTMLVAAIVLTAALAGRATAGSPPALLGWTTVAMAGIGLANVVLPVIVKESFPDRIGALTGAYTAALSLGTALGAAASIPVTQAAGGWRSGLGVWAVMAALAVPLWLPAARRARSRPAPGPVGGGRPVVGLLRSPTAWGLMVFFGVQALGAYALIGWLPQIYRDAGIAPATAGLLLATVTVLAAPVSLILPALATRGRDQRWWVVVVTAFTGLGYLGLILAPGAGAWLWAVLIGVGSGAFPLSLAMIGLRVRSPDTTAPLSAFTQSGGYLLASLGPLSVGLLHDATGGWSVPLGLLLVLLVPQLAGGWLAAQDRPVDPEPDRSARVMLRSPSRTPPRWEGSCSTSDSAVPVCRSPGSASAR